MARECVIDTCVLQKANAPLTKEPSVGSLFRRRLILLKQIADGHLTPLWSAKLMGEYRRQVKQPRNDFIRAFFELLLDRKRSIENWKHQWSGADRAAAAGCRFPRHDQHLLRTAVRGHPTTIYTEEQVLAATDACIYQHFLVHVLDIRR